MRTQYNIQFNNPSKGLIDWLDSVAPDVNKPHSKWMDDLYQHYFKLVEEFRQFLNSEDIIEDQAKMRMKPIDIYNAIGYYRIRIEKLLLIINLKLYKTHNVNKDTKVEYVVMRALWIDENGKTFRKFSKNLGAEKNVYVNGKIPVKILESVEEYMRIVMKDLYLLEYQDFMRFTTTDEDGNKRIKD